MYRSCKEIVSLSTCIHVSLSSSEVFVLLFVFVIPNNQISELPESNVQLSAAFPKARTMKLEQKNPNVLETPGMLRSLTTRGNWYLSRYFLL